MGENRSVGHSGSSVSLKSTVWHGLWLGNNASPGSLCNSEGTIAEILFNCSKALMLMSLGRDSWVFNALSFVSFLRLRRHPFPSGRECFNLGVLTTPHTTFGLPHSPLFLHDSLALKRLIKSNDYFLLLLARYQATPPQHNHSFSDFLVLSCWNNHSLLQIRIFSPWSRLTEAIIYGNIHECLESSW